MGFLVRTDVINLVYALAMFLSFGLWKPTSTWPLIAVVAIGCFIHKQLNWNTAAGDIGAFLLGHCVSSWLWALTFTQLWPQASLGWIGPLSLVLPVFAVIYLAIVAPDQHTSAGFQKWGRWRLMFEHIGVTAEWFYALMSVSPIGVAFVGLDLLSWLYYTLRPNRLTAAAV